MDLPAIPTGPVRRAGRLGASGRHSDWISDDLPFLSPFHLPPSSPFAFLSFLLFLYLPGHGVERSQSCFTDVTINGLRDSVLKKFTDDDGECFAGGTDNSSGHSLSDENPGCNAPDVKAGLFFSFLSFSSSLLLFSLFH